MLEHVFTENYNKGIFMNDQGDGIIDYEDKKEVGSGECHPPEHVMQYFAYEHLSPKLQLISKPFSLMAYGIIDIVPSNPERTKALNKLLEAKDCAVRAFMSKPL
jgi:hypothetical protein